MELKLITHPLEEVAADAVVILAFEKEEGAATAPPAVARDWFEGLYRSGEFKGKMLEMALLHRPAGMRAQRLLAVGGGKAGKFGPAELRRAAGAALRYLKPKGAGSIVLWLDRGLLNEESVAAAAEGAILGDYEPDRYKTENRDEKKTVDSFALAAAAWTPVLDQAARRGRIVAESQNFARDLVSEPGNRLTPAELAGRAREMAAAAGLECDVLDRERMRELGMGALLGVAAGSAQPPALILVRYRPEGEPAGGVHLGLIGKGITFDSGGISIKPSENMDKMKYDMAGGAAVLGAMRALAELKPRVAVTALVPAVENMPGGGAQRPGDIVATLSGKTVEVLNTDAEGRLILADAITYAKRLGCTHLVDAATLTGAIVVALGYVYIGAFANDDGMRERVLGAARGAGEKMWPMPLDDEYKEVLKSAFADLPNIGNRWGGAITAAMFLKEFVETTPWVHLDIAGTAWLEEGKPYLAKGPSGVPVRTLIRLAAEWTD